MFAFGPTSIAFGPILIMAQGFKRPQLRTAMLTEQVRKGRPMNEAICYVNGEFCPASEAKISVFDRGLTGGEGVYDVTRSYGHKPFNSTTISPASIARCATPISIAA